MYGGLGCSVPRVPLLIYVGICLLLFCYCMIVLSMIHVISRTCYIHVMHCHALSFYLTSHTRVLPRRIYNTFYLIVGIVVIGFIYSHMFTILIIVYDKFNRLLWLIVLFGDPDGRTGISTTGSPFHTFSDCSSVSTTPICLLPSW